MTVTTQTTWNIPQDPNAITTIDAKAAELAAQGKEVSPFTVILGDTQVTVNRYWTDTATAEEWIAYVLTFNPVSAAIIS
jgi:hypothetical protein